VDVQVLAREAGVSKALVFHHFRGVQGLHDAMAERVLHGTQAGLDALAKEYPGPQERVEALARALLSAPPDPPEATRRVLRFWLSEGGAGRSRDALVTDFVAKALRQMRYHGDARDVATFLLARWHGATAVYANGGAMDFEQEAERTLSQLERMFRP
jgi:AcrR family transcriptional regulator